MKRRVPGLAAALVLAGLSADCDEILGPELAGESYYLELVDGYRTPVLVESWFRYRGSSCELELIDATISFERHDRYELTWALREVCRGWRYTDVRYPTYRDRGHYDRFGRSLRFYPDRDWSYRGSVSGRSLRIDWDGHRFEFRRDRHGWW